MNQAEKERLALLKSYGTLTREQADEYVELVLKERAGIVEAEIVEEVAVEGEEVVAEKPKRKKK